MPYHIASFIGIVLQTSANDNFDDGDNGARTTEIKLKIVGKWTVSRVKTHQIEAGIGRKKVALQKRGEHSMKSGASVGGKSLAIF